MRIVVHDPGTLDHPGIAISIDKEMLFTSTHLKLQPMMGRSLMADNNAVKAT